MLRIPAHNGGRGPLVCTEPILGCLGELVADGGFVEGASDPSPDGYRVVASG